MCVCGGGDLSRGEYVRAVATRVEPGLPSNRQSTSKSHETRPNLSKSQAPFVNVAGAVCVLRIFLHAMNNFFPVTTLRTIQIRDRVDGLQPHPSRPKDTNARARTILRMYVSAAAQGNVIPAATGVRCATASQGSPRWPVLHHTC